MSTPVAAPDDQRLGQALCSSGYWCSAGKAIACGVGTYSDLSVAVRYSMSSSSVLLRLVTDSFIKCGADISYVSAFPSESEYLYPPLSYLQPIDKPRVSIQLGDSSFRRRESKGRRVVPDDEKHDLAQRHGRIREP